MKKIGLIGSLCKERESTSGQAIRTTILYDALIEKYGSDNVYSVNTYYKKKVVYLAIKSIICFFTCKDIIIMVSQNGCKTYYPILSFLSKVFKKRVYNNIIGGNIAELINANPKFKGYMKSFTVNWVQMKSIVEELKRNDIMNSEVLPNSKPIRIIEDIKTKTYEYPLKFCTFSRINKQKGIELAIEAIEQINQNSAEPIAALDIYGKPDESYRVAFEQIISNTSTNIKYKGVSPYDKSSDVLKDYFMLLFPTTFYGEGFPGTILDAYAAQLPVIASDWKYNPELIVNGVTGYLYDHTDPGELKKKICDAIDHPEQVQAMRNECRKEAEKYTPDKVLPIIFDKIDHYREKKN